MRLWWPSAERARGLSAPAQHQGLDYDYPTLYVLVHDRRVGLSDLHEANEAP